jgi:hypothetical protein
MEKVGTGSERKLITENAKSNTAAYLINKANTYIIEDQKLP